MATIRNTQLSYTEHVPHIHNSLFDEKSKVFVEKKVEKDKFKYFKERAHGVR
jgi:hypothetical protein